MAELFEKVFKSQTIHETLFFNVKSVLINPSLEGLKSQNEMLWKRWKILAKTKYRFKSKLEGLTSDEHAQIIYEDYAPNYAEFTKIIAITYASVYIDEDSGLLKRYLKKIVNEDEYIVLSTFLEELYKLSTEGTQSRPQFFPILCGYNIINYDIPHLIKKIILYRDKFEKGVPLILKNCLNSKPWESTVIDVVNVWKFNGFDNIPLMLISDYVGLKKTVDLVSNDELSKLYWDMISIDTEKALEYVSLQSATQTNLVIQLMNIMRNL